MDRHDIGPDPGLPSSVCVALAAARRYRGWSLRTAAEHLRIGAPYVSRLERGVRIPRPDVAAALAGVYDLDPAAALELWQAVDERHGLPDRYRDRLAAPSDETDAPTRAADVQTPAAVQPQRREHGADERVVLAPIRRPGSGLALTADRYPYLAHESQQ